ncbi:MAG: hypothetical protein ACOYJ2_03640 [Rickettsiales bacterium]
MDHLLAIINIIQKANGKRLIARLFSHLAIIIGLLLTTAIMVSATLIGGLINLHIALLNGGVSAPIALLIIASTALFIIAVLITMIVWRLKSLRRIPQTLSVGSSFTARAMDTLDAFTDGLMAD